MLSLKFLTIAALLQGALGVPAPAIDKRDAVLLTDITKIQTHWGEVTPTHQNAANFFGVENVGLPDGCGYEQVHILHRHGARYPTSDSTDGALSEPMGAKVAAIQKATGANSFSGPLSFLNTYEYQLGEGILVPTGGAQDYTSGAQFWNSIGRLLYDAVPGQAFYNATAVNGTARPLPLLRTTSEERILDSALAWAGGFFGVNASSQYNLLVIPEGGTENNTLASYDECTLSDDAGYGTLGEAAVLAYIPLFLKDATNRLNNYLVDGNYSFTVQDAYGMMVACSYEYNSLGSSDFCYLFTEDEWISFEYTHDIEYYYDYAFGGPTGRAQGIGYVQELFARLNQQYITVGNSSTNVTLDNNAESFPLGQRFYLDMSHDDIIISVLAALSLDYLKNDLPLTAVPPPADRTFKLTDLTPFGARLYTQIIGCNSATPTEKATESTIYNKEANGYNATTAVHKFVRLTLNSGILPISTIEGGLCAGRSDGMCALADFKESQTDAYAKAAYQFACHGNYSAGIVADGAPAS